MGPCHFLVNKMCSKNFLKGERYTPILPKSLGNCFILRQGHLWPFMVHNYLIWCLSTTSGSCSRYFSRVVKVTDFPKKGDGAISPCYLGLVSSSRQSGGYTLCSAPNEVPNLGPSSQKGHKKVPTLLMRKTTFQWSKVVSEAIFPTN